MRFCGFHVPLCLSVCVPKGFMCVRVFQARVFAGTLGMGDDMMKVMVMFFAADGDTTRTMMILITTFI